MAVVKTKQYMRGLHVITSQDRSLLGPVGKGSGPT